MAITPRTTLRRLLARIAVLIVAVASFAAVPTSAAAAPPHCTHPEQSKGVMVGTNTIIVVNMWACDEGIISLPVSLSRLVPVSPPIYWNVIASGYGQIIYTCPAHLPGIFDTNISEQFNANCAP